MRTYYGELVNYERYIEDETHKVVAWKELPYSFELSNRTEFNLSVISGKKDLKTVKPHETITISCNDWRDGDVKVFAKEEEHLECSFVVERGCMVERNYCNQIRSLYIVPIFNNGNIEIITSKSCEVDLGNIPNYAITPIKEPFNILKISNYTSYNVIISLNEQVIQKIERYKKKEGKKIIQTVEVGVPECCTLYIDTEIEETIWSGRYGNFPKRILSRVNGCCIQIFNGKYHKCGIILGPTLAEPYIRYLYTSKSIDEENISIFCWDIDQRLE